jgi:hypothetical protein
MITRSVNAEALPKRNIRQKVGALTEMLFICMSSLRRAKKFYCTVQVFPSALVHEKPLILVN